MSHRDPGYAAPKRTSRPAPKARAGTFWLLGTLFVIGLGVQASNTPTAGAAAYWLFFGAVVLLRRSRKDRCILLPKTRQAALDTLRGMARHGSITSYDECKNGRSPCHACTVATKERDSWNVGWHIREDGHGIVWLLGDVDKAFAGYGYAYRGWALLMAAVDVPMLQRKQDSTGFYWTPA